MTFDKLYVYGVVDVRLGNIKRIYFHEREAVRMAKIDMFEVVTPYEIALDDAAVQVLKTIVMSALGH